MVNSHANEFSPKLPYSNAHTQKKFPQNLNQGFAATGWRRNCSSSLSVYQYITQIFTWQKNKHDIENLYFLTKMVAQMVLKRT